MALLGARHIFQVSGLRVKERRQSPKTQQFDLYSPTVQFEHAPYLFHKSARGRQVGRYPPRPVSVP